MAKHTAVTVDAETHAQLRDLSNSTGISIKRLVLFIWRAFQLSHRTWIRESKQNGAKGKGRGK